MEERVPHLEKHPELVGMSFVGLGLGQSDGFG